MIIEKNEVHQKLAKLQQGKKPLEFALTPQGFLLIKQGNVLDCGDFRVYNNGHYFSRQGFTYEASAVVPESGYMLCMLSGSKFLAPRTEDRFEFSSAKKPLSEDFSFVLNFHAVNKIVLLIADGLFAPEAFTVTLTDTPENERFCLAVMKKILDDRNPEAALKLTEEKEAEEDGEE